MRDWKFIKGSPEGDFWEQNPEIQYFTHVKPLIKEFGKEKAGKIMWAIYMTEDYESSFYGLRKEMRRDQVEKNFLDFEIDWEHPVIEKTIDRYPEFSMPPAKRRFQRIGDSYDAVLKRLEEGGNTKDDSMTLKRLNEVLEKVEENWIKDKNQRASETGGASANTAFWS